MRIGKRTNNSCNLSLVGAPFQPTNVDFGNTRRLTSAPSHLRRIIFSEKSCERNFNNKQLFVALIKRNNQGKILFFHCSKNLGSDMSDDNFFKYGRSAWILFLFGIL